MDNPRPPFILFSIFFQHSIDFLQQINVQNIHVITGSGIRLNTNLLDTITTRPGLTPFLYWYWLPKWDSGHPLWRDCKVDGSNLSQFFPKRSWNGSKTDWDVSLGPIIIGHWANDSLQYVGFKNDVWKKNANKIVAIIGPVIISLWFSFINTSLV